MDAQEMSFEALAEPVTKLRTCQVEVELHPVAELPNVVGTSGLERQSARYGKLQRAIRSGSGPKEQVALQADTLAMQRQGEEQQREKKRQAEGKDILRALKGLQIRQTDPRAVQMLTYSFQSIKEVDAMAGMAQLVAAK